MYQAHVAGKPRLSGVRAALEQLGVPDAEQQAIVYARRKQKRLEELIAAGSFSAFPDALRFVQAVKALGMRMAVASSSKNANQMLELIHFGSGQNLFDAFNANVCGRDLQHRKPSPEIFLLAASELGMAPGDCFVVEDAPAGIRAARTGGMTALGVARHQDAATAAAPAANPIAAAREVRKTTRRSKVFLWLGKRQGSRVRSWDRSALSKVIHKPNGQETIGPSW